jgi:hypothetical protein
MKETTLRRTLQSNNVDVYNLDSDLTNALHRAILDECGTYNKDEFIAPYFNGKKWKEHPEVEQDKEFFETMIEEIENFFKKNDIEYENYSEDTTKNRETSFEFCGYNKNSGEEKYLLNASMYKSDSNSAYNADFEIITSTMFQSWPDFADNILKVCAAPNPEMKKEDNGIELNKIEFVKWWNSYAAKEYHVNKKH